MKYISLVFTHIYISLIFHTYPIDNPSRAHTPPGTPLTAYVRVVPPPGGSPVQDRNVRVCEVDGRQDVPR